MKPLLAALIALVATSAAPADDAPLKEARQRWLRGNLAEARALYEKLQKQHPVAAALGISKTWEGEGEYEKAQAVVDKALAEHPKSADLHARRAELLHFRGQWKEAEQSAGKALEIAKEHFLARWVLVQVCRDRGDLAKYEAECRWFVRTYTARSNADMDIKDPDELLLVARAGTEDARWFSLAGQFRFILNDVLADALEADKDFWPAETHAGMMLLEKYNKPDAVAAFDKALKTNPNCPEALVGKGLAALQSYELREAEQFADRALRTNPRLPEALQLRADLHLFAGDVPAAVKVLELARKVNPRDESTLGRIAACLFIQNKKAELDALVKEVEQHDPKPAVFYHELAERLDDRRRYLDAERFFRKAIELRPKLPWSQNSLGLLLMRLGQEKEATDVLTKAFKADTFNERVSNTLKVLRHLEKYETIKTEHFELRYDAKTDRVLAGYLALMLEDLYEELAEKFQYRPKGPILFEVFNNHEMFSGRVIALPDLHTIGACTGRMFAMVSPRGKGIDKPFNWARVVRHELVHIFNLEQTDFQVPHWLTEGLAVSSEGFPRPQPWNQLLLERVPAGDLMDLDTVDMGFIRPRTRLDWHMAYCQSQLYVEHMQKKYGPKTVGEMLAAYRDGLDTAAAVQKVCKVDKATFEKGYREYLNEVVKSLGGKPAEKAMTLTELREAYEKTPADLDIAARLAEQYQLRGRNADARKIVDAVLLKKKNHPLASYVKSKLLRLAGEDEEAFKLLQAAVDPKDPEPKILLELGKAAFDAKEFAKAVEYFEIGRKAQPAESKWLVELVRTHALAGNKDKQIEALAALAPTDADDLDVRKRLARMLFDAGKFPEAEKAAKQALEIDVLDADSQEVLLDSLAKQKKEAEAAKYKKLFGK